MGRLVGIPHFSTEKALDEEKADAAELCQARAALGEDYDPLTINDDEANPIRDCQVAIARRMQVQFEKCILRRTIDSRNWEGRPLIDLLACHEHTILLSLQLFE